MNYITVNTEHRSMPVHPMLVTFMQGIFAKAPNIQFQAYDSNNSEVTTVLAWHDTELVGRAAIDRRVSEAKGNILEYQITSDLIRKTKGRVRNTKTTANLKVAIKTALAVFKQIGSTAKTDNYISNAESKIMRNVALARRMVDGQSVEGDKLTCFQYVLDAVKAKQQGESVPDPNSDLITRASKFKDSMHTYQIAKSLLDEFNSKNGAIVIVERTGAISFIDIRNKSIASMQGMDELPLNYQEKFSLLHIVDDNQAVQHVGMKWDFNITEGNDIKVYFLVGGNTVAY